VGCRCDYQLGAVGCRFWLTSRLPSTDESGSSCSLVLLYLHPCVMRACVAVIKTVSRLGAATSRHDNRPFCFDGERIRWGALVERKHETRDRSLESQSTDRDCPRDRALLQRRVTVRVNELVRKSRYPR